MLTLSVWKSFLHTIQLGCGGLGVLLNFLLILLIIFRSPARLGAYKYLMIYISAFEMCYCILDAIIEPNIFSQGPAFIVFRYFEGSAFGRGQGFYLIVIYCASYALSIALFAIHFIYRYGASDNVFRKKYLEGWKKLGVLFLVPVFYFCWWALLIYVTYVPSRETDEFMRDSFLRDFESNIEEVSYGIAQFYSIDPKSNKLRIVWSTFIGMSNMWFMMTSSFSCVFYFGIKCYRRITKALKNSKLSSYYARSIQQQLFQALVMQTLIPVVLMYIPVGILFFFPMFNINVGFLSSFAAATIALYPAVDPLPTMFIVESYRKTILCGCSVAVDNKEEVNKRRTNTG